MGIPDHFTGVQLYAIVDNTLVPVAADENGQLFALLKGWDGGSYVPLRLDENGRIEAVIKGEYEGNLASVALDSQGRLLIVPTDPENIWGYATYMGNAELAARLGAITNFDYRGAVVWLAAFEQGEGCFTYSGSGAGSEHYLDTDVFEIGGYGQHLIGGSSAGWSMLMRRSAPVPVSGRLGFEVSFSVVADVSYVQIDIVRFNGTDAIQGSIKLDVANEKIYYKDDSLSWIELDTGIVFDPALSYFNAIKLVIEQETDYYTRLLCNTSEYDLSGYTLASTPSGIDAMIRTQVTVVSTTGNNGEIVLGRWIETRNEPANE